MKIGQAIRMVRLRRGMDVKELARRCDVSGTAVVNWESGRSDPRPETLAKAAEALEISLAYLQSGGIEAGESAIDDVLLTARERLAELLGVPKERIAVEFRYTV